jgi:hypothetical protein
MELITIIILQLIVVIIGMLVALAFGVKEKIEILGLAYLLGSALLTLLFFLTHWLLNWNLDQQNLIVCVIASLVGLFVLAVFRHQTNQFERIFTFKISESWRRLEKIEKMIVAAVILFFIYSLFINYHTPMTDWDALAFYDFRAKIMTADGNMARGASLEYFFQYPPYTTFLHVFGYLFNAQHVKLAYSMIYGSFLLTFFTLVRRRTDRAISLIALFLLASFPTVLEHSVTAYSNLSYTVFYALGVMYLWQSVHFKNRKDLLLGSALIGLSTWVRSTEPFWLIGAFLIVWGYLKNRRYLFESLLGIGWLSLPNYLWRLFIGKLSADTASNLIDTETHTVSAVKSFFQLQEGIQVWLIHTWETSAYLVKVLLPEFFFLFLLWFLANKTFMKKWNMEMSTLFLLLAIVWGGTFIFSFTFETWNKIDGSIVRMCMIFIPLLLFSLVNNLKYVKRNNVKK